MKTTVAMRTNELTKYRMYRNLDDLLWMGMIIGSKPHVNLIITIKMLTIKNVLNLHEKRLKIDDFSKNIRTFSCRLVCNL